ncbi:hypothetical protein BGZ72_010533, partial [Mortierella alpina]
TTGKPKVKKGKEGSGMVKGKPSVCVGKSEARKNAQSNKSDDEKERELAEMISKDKNCNDDRSEEWFNCIMCCQGMNPYNLKTKEELKQTLKSKLNRNPGETKDELCGTMADYATQLKEVVVEWKKDIKSTDNTDKGMKDFFQKKMDCFMDCEEKDLPSKRQCEP